MEYATQPTQIHAQRSRATSLTFRCANTGDAVDARKSTGRDRGLNVPAVIDVTNFHKGTRHRPITRLTRADKSRKIHCSQYRAQLPLARVLHACVFATRDEKTYGRGVR